MRRKPLFWQIYPSYVLVVIAALSAVALFAFRSVRDFHMRQTAGELEARALLAAGRIAEAGAPADTAIADALCDEMGRRTAARYTVILPDGEVAGDSERDPEEMDNHANRPEFVQALYGETGESVRYSRTLRRHMMYVAVPMLENGRVTAVMRASMPLTRVEAAVAGVYRSIITAFAATLLIAAGLGLVLSRRLTRPIAEMQRAAAQLADRRFDFRLPRPRSREIEGLAESINRLARDLHARVNELTVQRNERDAMFASMREAVVALDERGRVIFLNAAAEDALDLAADQSLGRNIRELVRNTSLFELIDAALATPDVVQADIPLRTDGERILQARGTTLTGPDGSRRGALLVLEDVTRTRRLEQVRRDFVTNVSHELRTPVTSIKGFVETLLDGALDDRARAERFLSIIGKQAGTLTAIIDDLLTLASLEAPGHERNLSFAEQELEPTARRALEVCEHKAETAGVSLTLRCEEGLRARVHPGLLEQALVNLLQNAIEYSQAGDCVVVAAERRGREIALSVKDTGCGIAARHLPRLFERFYRVEKGRQRKPGGTGLGLSIVKHIAAVHGGRAEVVSAPGAGSTFTIVLPAADRGPAAGNG